VEEKSFETLQEQKIHWRTFDEIEFLMDYKCDFQFQHCVVTREKLSISAVVFMWLSMNFASVTTKVF